MVYYVGTPFRRGPCFRVRGTGALWEIIFVADRCPKMTKDAEQNENSKILIKHFFMG